MTVLFRWMKGIELNLAGVAVTCRLCHSSVKRSGVLCQSCGMICHTTCSSQAPSTCDVTGQLTLMSRQQDLLRTRTQSTTSVLTIHASIPNDAYASAYGLVSQRNGQSHDEGELSGVGVTAGQQSVVQGVQQRLRNGLDGLRLRRQSNGPERSRRDSRPKSRIEAPIEVDFQPEVARMHGDLDDEMEAGATRPPESAQTSKRPTGARRRQAFSHPKPVAQSVDVDVEILSAREQGPTRPGLLQRKSDCVMM